MHEALAKDDIVASSAESLSKRIEGIAELWVGQPSTCEKLSELLGMPAKKGETVEECMVGVGAGLFPPRTA